MTPIANLDAYNHGMHQNYLDKVFFMDKIQADYIIDFGCGDGGMANFLAKIFPHQTFVLYDENPAMCALAQQANYHNANVVVYDDKRSPQFKEFVGNLRGRKALVLSSVLHELIAYKTGAEVTEFMHWVETMQFDYIVVRDMCWKPIEPVRLSEYEAKIADMKNVANLFRFGDRDQIIDYETVSFAQDYHSNYFLPRKVNIENVEDLYEYLLKYRYTENWEREKNERYFGATHFLQDYFYHGTGLHNSPKTRYDEIYREHFIPTFIKDSVKAKFNIDMVHNTHVKIILQKR